MFQAHCTNLDMTNLEEDFIVFSLVYSSSIFGGLLEGSRIDVEIVFSFYHYLKVLFDIFQTS